ncbi:MAG: M28 family peptidase [Gammaproteobacteria bacterium]|nr:M28 family peptidase [Gammaproteobacteria bacterium]
MPSTTLRRFRSAAAGRRAAARIPSIAAILSIVPILTFGPLADLVLAASSPALVAQEAAPAIETIRQSDLRADLSFLAGDEMGGRLAGSPEGRIASAFIKSRFERLGLTPVGDGGSYYHSFNVVQTEVGEDNRLTVMLDRGVTLSRERGQDFYPLRESGTGTAGGKVVFAGFGISAPELGHDDYRGVAGRIVLIVDHEPAESDPGSAFDGLVNSEAAAAYRKIAAAEAAGALGVLLVTDVHNHPGPVNFSAQAEGYWPSTPRRIGRYTLASRLDRISIPALRISPALAENLVSGTGRTLEELSRSAEAAGGIQSVMLPGVRVDISADVRRETRTERNVVGLIEGSDPELRDEWIIICAHFDHEGTDGAVVYNGADDDGSGTVGLIEIAEAYQEAAQRGETPRRSVLLAAWDFEERGLLGAWAWVENPLHPLEQTVAVLNMDMIGRNEEVVVGGGNRFRGLDVQSGESNANAINIMGTTRSADLRSEVEQANAVVGLEMRFRYDNHPIQLLRRSDHWPFMQAGVPALFYHTGLHPDYHRRDDVPERINWEKLEKVVRLVYQTSWSLARRPEGPARISER